MVHVVGQSVRASARFPALGQLLRGREQPCVLQSSLRIKAQALLEAARDILHKPLETARSSQVPGKGGPVMARIDR